MERGDRPERHKEAGAPLLRGGSSPWCYAFAGLALVVVWVAAPLMLDSLRPFVTQAVSDLKSLKPEWVAFAFDKLGLLVRLLALYSAAAYCWQCFFSGLELHPGGLTHRSGYFLRETSSVPFRRVRALRFSQNLLQKWLDYGYLSVDFGSPQGPLVVRGLGGILAWTELLNRHFADFLKEARQA